MSGIKKELLLREIEGKLDVLEMYEQIKSMKLMIQEMKSDLIHINHSLTNVKFSAAMCECSLHVRKETKKD